MGSREGLNFGFGQHTPAIRRRDRSRWHRFWLSIEQWFDGWTRPLVARLGGDVPRSVLGFDGWWNGTVTRFGARVLNNPSVGPADADASLWQNFLHTWNRWNTHELAGVIVRAADSETETDGEGYAWFDLPGSEPPPESITVVAERRDARVQTEVRIFRPSGPIGLISDIDDTVLHTGITRLWVAARLTFFGNARTRTALPGVAELYRAIDAAGLPIFYVSSSAWNLHDLLIDFMADKGLPPGPLLLRDLGTDESKLFKSPGHGHKLERALRILDDFPGMDFVLSGDSGQADAELYAELAELRPGRVRAVLIRDVDGLELTPRDHHVAEHLGRLTRAGIPAALFQSSEQAGTLLRELGILPEAPGEPASAGGGSPAARPAR